MAFAFDNLYVKQQLEALHSNILVLNHPASSPALSFVWSHHDKIVVVDREKVRLNSASFWQGGREIIEYECALAVEKTNIGARC